MGCDAYGRFSVTPSSVAKAARLPFPQIDPVTRVRILILTSSTGAGHDTRAQAFAEWCFELYRHNVDVRIEQMLEKSSGFYSVGVRFYNWIQQKSPWIHKAFFLFVELLAFLNRRSVSFGRTYYELVLREYQPH